MKSNLFNPRAVFFEYLIQNQRFILPFPTLTRITRPASRPAALQSRLQDIGGSNRRLICHPPCTTPTPTQLLLAATPTTTLTGRAFPSPKRRRVVLLTPTGAPQKSHTAVKLEESEELSPARTLQLSLRHPACSRRSANRAETITEW